MIIAGFVWDWNDICLVFLVNALFGKQIGRKGIDSAVAFLTCVNIYEIGAKFSASVTCAM